MTVLPSLAPEQVNDLIRASEGRAISYVDEPEWFCGKRHCSHMGRDGMTPTAHGDGGTMQSLAGSLRSKCADYLTNRNGIEYARRRAESLEAEWIAESKRKTPRKRHMANLAQDLRYAQQGIQTCEQNITDLIARYFRGYEGRLLSLEAK
jgi:hypothetical protein